MVVTSNIKLIVGTTVIPRTIILDNREDPVPPQPIFIIKKSTKEEYLEECRRDNLDTFISSDYPYYYEVSTD